MQLRQNTKSISLHKSCKKNSRPILYLQQMFQRLCSKLEFTSVYHNNYCWILAAKKTFREPCVQEN